MPHYDTHWHTHSTLFNYTFTGLQWYICIACIPDIPPFEIASISLASTICPLFLAALNNCLKVACSPLVFNQWHRHWYFCSQGFISLNYSINLTVRYIYLMASIFQSKDNMWATLMSSFVVGLRGAMTSTLPNNPACGFCAFTVITVIYWRPGCTICVKNNAISTYSMCSSIICIAMVICTVALSILMLTSISSYVHINYTKHINLYSLAQ